MRNAALAAQYHRLPADRTGSRTDNPTMTARRAQAIGRSLDTLFRVGTLGTLSDGELLECLTSTQSSAGEDAFRALVERHGPMVLGLCRIRCAGRCYCAAWKG